jgi:hypothetical protein
MRRLRGDHVQLEHFRASGAAPDAALRDAVGVVRQKRRADGRWPVHRPHPGRYWFALEAPGPSRWATLRALRVLDWWDEGAAAIFPGSLINKPHDTDQNLSRDT